MSLKKIYYLLKPLLSRRAQLAFRRVNIKLKMQKTRDLWPINKSICNPPTGWQGWPQAKKFAVVITHDVETFLGVQNIKYLAETDLHYGFKASFNIVPCKYIIPTAVRRWLRNKGFEVGIHDYNHDGKLYWSKEIFDKRAAVINDYIKRWDVCGFRSAAMHHNLDWIANLNILYDCSTFDIDPFEPQPDGVNTIFPFWYKRKDSLNGFVEIPYTLPQDFTLFVLMKEKDCSVWKKKLQWIAEKGGMATVIVHPDYINFKRDGKTDFNKYSIELYESFLQHIQSEYKNQYWNPLPQDVGVFIKNLNDINLTPKIV